MTEETMDRPPLLAARRHVLRYAVCYPDTDAGGVVNHGRYIEMAERARNDLLRQVGLPYARLCADHGTLLVIHKLSATYHRSALLEDELDIGTELTRCSPARTIWITDIRRDDTLLATVHAELAALDAGSKAVRSHPDVLLNRLAPFCARTA
jgi:acyl-CoA thioester hydrolase